MSAAQHIDHIVQLFRFRFRHLAEPLRMPDDRRRSQGQGRAAAGPLGLNGGRARHLGLLGGNGRERFQDVGCFIGEGVESSI